MGFEDCVYGRKDKNELKEERERRIKFLQIDVNLSSLLISQSFPMHC
jgi:hypothetical protein